MTRTLRRFLLGLTLATVSTATLWAQQSETDRVAEAARVLDEILAVKDNSIPKKILDEARAIVVIPSTVKGAFVVGGQRGKGVISGRFDGQWSPPAFITLTGGSIGFQIGGQATDIVLVVMNERGLNNLLQNSFKIGGNASVAAGPVGREATASTDYRFQAEILSYSRSRGLFAGISLAGSTIRADRDANEKIYGVGYNTKQILVEKKGGVPPAVMPWLDTLKKVS
ncbi:MAG: lipid-binding SYLF domain-containing protein [Vicinamibacterales bacterium]